jgi:hypothetical protein
MKDDEEETGQRIILLCSALALAAALFVLSTAAASAQSNDNLIVPGQRIGKAYIGMPIGELSGALGKTKTTYMRPSGDWVNYCFADLCLRVGASQTVTAIWTESVKFRTREGAGVGSQDLEIRTALGPPLCVIQAASGMPGPALIYRQLSFQNNKTGEVVQVEIATRTDRCD